MQNKVIEFNREILGIHQRDRGMLGDSEIEISHQCLIEEASELMVAHGKGDYIGCIDSVIDGIYFGFGILYKLGLNGDEIGEIFDAVHHCNMTKKRGVNAKRDTGAADAVKPEGWVGPEERILDILSRTE